ncbi:ABC transporter ATP-binding protein [Mammaliicoccus sciuri]|uniref:ABC transporter ATP-binding protein n=1 Tax=Mammaliicoccus sciuri TaxID=1296 RepID=UPI0033650529
MLAFENVTKSFKDGNRTIEAVKSTNFKLEKGELVAIIGPSGSGKSTLLTMAGALQLPSEGTVSLNGQNINQFNEKQLSKLRLKEIGFILQTSNLIPFLIVQQQFELLKKVKKDVMNEEEHTRLLKQLGLDKILSQLPSGISGGQKQRVAMAKALYTNPSVILADEPTASLDTENAIEVMEILRRETKELNKLCIIVTHDQRLTSYCDKVFKMVDGELKEEV